jgi:hypothetical protein
MTRTVEELRKIAEAATDGPWRRGSGRDAQTVFDAQARVVADKCGYNDGFFIAAFNPQAVLELLSSYSQMREALEEALRFMESKFGEFDVEDCDGDNLCPKCESVGCIKFKFNLIRAALSLNPTTGDKA